MIDEAIIIHHIVQHHVVFTQQQSKMLSRYILYTAHYITIRLKWRMDTVI